MVDTAVIKPTCFKEVIDLWPSHSVMARDIAAPATAIPKWAQRGRIPSEWWASITATAVAKAAGVDADLLASFAAKDMSQRLTEARA